MFIERRRELGMSIRKARRHIRQKIADDFLRHRVQPLEQRPHPPIAHDKRSKNDAAVVSLQSDRQATNRKIVGHTYHAWCTAAWD